MTTNRSVVVLDVSAWLIYPRGEGRLGFQEPRDRIVEQICEFHQRHVSEVDSDVNTILSNWRYVDFSCRWISMVR